MWPKTWGLPLRCAHGSGGSGRARGWATPWHAIPTYRRPPWDHQVGGALVFFDNGPECVDLDLGEMEMADESCTDGRCVLSCHVEPVENAMRRVMGETCYSPQTVALAYEGQGFDRHQAWATHGLEERVLIGAKGVSTSCPVVTLFNVTEDLDVASFDCATIRTGFGVTPLPREFHAVFPPSQHDDTSNGLSWLGVPSEGFTAYVYSTPEPERVQP